LVLHPFCSCLLAVAQARRPERYFGHTLEAVVGSADAVCCACGSFNAVVACAIRVAYRFL